MHLDLDAYLALGGLVSILLISFGILGFVLLKKRWAPRRRHRPTSLNGYEKQS